MSKVIRSRLQAAAREHHYTYVERAQLDDGDEVEGFVIATSRAWTLLAAVVNMTLDGFTAVRTTDISRVRRRGSQDLMRRWLKRHGPWPPPSPAGEHFPLDEPSSIIMAASKHYGLVRLLEEAMDPGYAFIGLPDTFGRKSVRMHEIDSRARWTGGTTKFRYADITRIDFNDRYNLVLAALGGDHPRS